MLSIAEPVNFFARQKVSLHRNFGTDVISKQQAATSKYHPEPLRLSARDTPPSCNGIAACDGVRIQDTQAIRPGDATATSDRTGPSWGWHCCEGSVRAEGWGQEEEDGVGRGN